MFSEGSKWDLIAAIATPVLGLLGLVGKAIWSMIQQVRLERVERLAALTVRIHELENELKMERAEHWKTARALERLLGKYERERVASSNPPPS